MIYYSAEVFYKLNNNINFSEKLSADQIIELCVKILSKRSKDNFFGKGKESLNLELTNTIGDEIKRNIKEVKDYKIIKNAFIRIINRQISYCKDDSGGIVENLSKLKIESGESFSNSILLCTYISKAIKNGNYEVARSLLNHKAFSTVKGSKLYKLVISDLFKNNSITKDTKESLMKEINKVSKFEEKIASVIKNIIKDQNLDLLVYLSKNKCIDLTSLLTTISENRLLEVSTFRDELFFKLLKIALIDNDTNIVESIINGSGFKSCFDKKAVYNFYYKYLVQIEKPDENNKSSDSDDEDNNNYTDDQSVKKSLTHWWFALKEKIWAFWMKKIYDIEFKRIDYEFIYENYSPKTQKEAELILETLTENLYNFYRLSGTILKKGKLFLQPECIKGFPDDFKYALADIALIHGYNEEGFIKTLIESLGNELQEKHFCDLLKTINYTSKYNSNFLEIFDCLISNKHCNDYLKSSSLSSSVVAVLQGILNKAVEQNKVEIVNKIVEKCGDLSFVNENDIGDTFGMALRLDGNKEEMIKILVKNYNMELLNATTLECLNGNIPSGVEQLLTELVKIGCKETAKDLVAKVVINDNNNDNITISDELLGKIISTNSYETITSLIELIDNELMHNDENDNIGHQASQLDIVQHHDNVVISDHI